MSFGGPFGAGLRTSGLVIPTPIYAADSTNDFPIDLRKKAAIRRERNRSEYTNGYQSYSDDEDDDQRVDTFVASVPIGFGRNAWNKNGGEALYQGCSTPPPHPSLPLLANPYFLSLRNLHPLLAHQYGIQYALFTSHEGSTRIAPSDHLVTRNGSPKFPAEQRNSTPGVATDVRFAKADAYNGVEDDDERRHFPDDLSFRLGDSRARSPIKSYLMHHKEKSHSLRNEVSPSAPVYGNGVHRSSPRLPTESRLYGFHHQNHHHQRRHETNGYSEHHPSENCVSGEQLHDSKQLVHHRPKLR